ncbi:MAG: hypothetical protein KBT47_01605, partial [Armatimonadetes bacterium]|nr:hypothetical protein [Candidatus Hippobium faecium]
RDMFGNDMPFKGGNVTAGENPQYFIFNLSPKSVYSKIKGKFIKGGIEDIFVAKNDKIKIPEYTVYFMKDISLADDWNVQPVRVSSEKRFENDIPNEAEVKFVTDGKNIFVSYKVTGEKILPLNTKDYNMTWNGAGMEIFITLDENVRSNNKRKCDFQLCLNPGNGGEIVDIWSETDGRIPGSEVVYKPIENGYEMKAKIPVSYLNRYSEQDKELKFGDRLRLDWVVNIADEKGDRQAMLSTHSGSFSTDPSVWGKTVIK